MLKPPDNVKEISFFINNLKFPLAIFVCSEWEKTQVSYLNTSVHTSESLAKWCINHNISYQFIYILNVKSFIKNPLIAFEYIKLIKKMKLIRKL